MGYGKEQIQCSLRIPSFPPPPALHTYTLQLCEGQCLYPYGSSAPGRHFMNAYPQNGPKPTPTSPYLPQIHKFPGLQERISESQT